MTGATGGGTGGPGGAAYLPTQTGQGVGGGPRSPRPDRPPYPPSAPAGGFGPAQQEPPPQEGSAPGQPRSGTEEPPKPHSAARPVPRTRKARLRVAQADPWSVMKTSFLLSLALGVCTIVAVAVLWMVLDAMGVFSTLGSTISEATDSGTEGDFDLQGVLSLPRVLLFTSIIALIDVVLATALATLGAFIYNFAAGFVGGVELTLAEDE